MIKQGTLQSFCFSKTLHNSELIEKRVGAREGTEDEEKRETTAHQRKQCLLLRKKVLMTLVCDRANGLCKDDGEREGRKPEV